MPTTSNSAVNRLRTRDQTPPYVPVDPDFVVLCSQGYNPQRFKFDKRNARGGWALIMQLIENDYVPMRHRNELWLYGPPEGDE